MYRVGQIITSTDISERKLNFFISEHPCISEVIGAGAVQAETENSKREVALAVAFKH